jgi:catechol 2,3-dioxygenase-like lactoylglutathione lyase family enzyme
MYDHIGLKVGNLDASVRFYTAALAPLGYVLCSKDENGAGFGPKGEPALWLYPHKGPKNAGAHVAFRAPNPSAPAITPRSRHSMPKASKRAAATMAALARGRTIAQPITRPS